MGGATVPVGDLTGQSFGRWTVIALDGSDKRRKLLFRRSEQKMLDEVYEVEAETLIQ